MFEISQLKEKKLPELQELAKQLKVPKYRSLKKLDLVYQILDYQAANPKAVEEVIKPVQKTGAKPKPRPRAQKPRVNQPKAKPQANVPTPADKKEDPKKEDQTQPKAQNKPNKVERHTPNKVERPAQKQGDKKPQHPKTQTQNARIKINQEKITRNATKVIMVIKILETATENQILNSMQLSKVKVF